ncbi:unnamed protein product, partial [Gulo gulo]
MQTVFCINFVSHLGPAPFFGKCETRDPKSGKDLLCPQHVLGQWFTT